MISKKEYLKMVYADYPDADISESEFLDMYLDDPNFHKRFIRGLERIPRPKGFNSSVKRVIGLCTRNCELQTFHSVKHASMVTGVGSRTILQFCRGRINYRETGYSWKFEFEEVLNSEMLEQHLKGAKDALLSVSQ